MKQNPALFNRLDCPDSQTFRIITNRRRILRLLLTNLVGLAICAGFTTYAFVSHDIILICLNVALDLIYGPLMLTICTSLLTELFSKAPGFVLDAEGFFFGLSSAPKLRLPDHDIARIEVEPSQYGQDLRIVPANPLSFRASLGLADRWIACLSRKHCKADISLSLHLGVDDLRPFLAELQRRFGARFHAPDRSANGKHEFPMPIVTPPPLPGVMAAA